MAKVSYANLKLKLDTAVNTFNFNGYDIEVLKYLPTKDKYDLIMIALQKAEENGVYNEILLDMYFHLFMIYTYTNISFTDKQREDEFKIFDCLKCNGFIEAFLGAIEEEEYNELFALLEQVCESKQAYRNTAAAVIGKIVDDLPANAQAAADIVNGFDKEQYQQVLNFASAVGGQI